MWQGAQAIFNARLVTGLVILPASIISLGVAMTGAPGFGKRVGVTTVALGVVAAGAAVALLVDPMSSIAVIGVFALIVFHLVVGWRLYRGSAEVGAHRA